MPVDAVIFDMDGVLVDSEAYWYQSRIEFAEKRGKAWSMDDQHAAMGRSTVEWAQVMKDRLMLEMSLDDVIDEVRGGVIARIETRLPLLPGAIEAIHKAAVAYPAALASGSPTLVIDTVMKLTGLNNVFRTIVYGDDMKRGKPAPDIYLEAAKRLGISPENCVGIEDSVNGLKSLKAAGMYAIAVPSPGFTLPPTALALADRVLGSLEEFSIALVASLE